jgi:hypothetical protein
MATGRVQSMGVTGGSGEPYFVKRDQVGRISRVIYPNAVDSDLPQLETRYEYAKDGKVKRISTVDKGIQRAGKENRDRSKFF